MGPTYDMCLFSDPIKVFSLLIVQYGVHQWKLYSECWLTARFSLCMLAAARTSWANNHRELSLYCLLWCLAESGKSVIIRTGKGQGSPQWVRGMETDIINSPAKINPGLFLQPLNINIRSLMVKITRITHVAPRRNYQRPHNETTGSDDHQGYEKQWGVGCCTSRVEEPQWMDAGSH